LDSLISAGRPVRIILRTLQDPDELVRAFTVHAVGKYGTEDMIPALRKVAEADPSPEVEGHSIRKAAADAIAAIQKRAVAILVPE
jgi:HEAT repeat protein